MGCCEQNTTGAGAAAVDTSKRVNYTKGMLLGVDDFVQEQAWHIARRHELAREVLGYGTVRGLQVHVPDTEARVHVSPGVALMPSGTPVCVPTEQCCDIDGWLAKYWDSKVLPELERLPAGAPLRLHVVLAYDSRLTDLMPVPGEPCRSESDLTAASRVTDCFKLELRLQPPDQLEENAIRDFVDWLAKVPIDTSSPPMSETDFLQQLRDAAHFWEAPTSPYLGDFMFGSPPPSLGTTDALMRAALRLWVTEMRPRWRAHYGCGPHPAAPGGADDAVLLATLPLVLSGQRATLPVANDQTQRPVLLSLRMVQELITHNPAPEAAQSVQPALDFGLAPEVGTDPAYARADHSHGTPSLPLLDGDVEGEFADTEVVALRGHAIAEMDPDTDDVLVYDGTQWVPRPWPLPGSAVVEERRFGLGATAGLATTSQFAKADHSHGTPEIRGDVAAVDVSAGTSVQQHLRVHGLRNVPIEAVTSLVDGQVLTLKAASGGGFTWRPVALPAPPTPPTLGGDINGTLDNMNIQQLQGHDLKAASPLDGDILVFDAPNKTWVTSQPSGGGTPSGNFVEREAGPYRLVAAGEARIVLTDFDKGVVSMLSRYSGLSGSLDTANRRTGPELRLRFAAKVKQAQFEKAAYIVKLTPVWPPEADAPDTDLITPEFQPYLVDRVKAPKPESIEFTVRLRLSGDPQKGQIYGLQIEVSRFEG